MEYYLLLLSSPTGLFYPFYSFLNCNVFVQSCVFLCVASSVCVLVRNVAKPGEENIGVLLS